MRERLERLGRRWPWLGWVLAVQDRFGELGGSSAASGITLVAFLALFPLLLVAISVVGFISSSGTDVTGSLIRNLGLTGDGADTMRQAVQSAQHSATAASVIGLLGLAWSGLGLVVALQRGVNLPWQIEAKGLRARLLGVPWLLGLVVILAVSFGLSTVIGFLPGFLAPVSVVLGLAVDVGLFLWTFWLLGAAEVPWRRLLPGAVVAAIGFEILKVVGTVYVPRAVSNASALYGSLGIVFALLAWLGFFGRLFVYASVVNVVAYERREGTDSVAIELPALAGRDLTAITRAGTVPTEKRKKPKDDEKAGAGPLGWLRRRRAGRSAGSTG